MNNEKLDVNVNININPADDHNPKFNVAKSELEKANKKILEMSQQKRDKDTIVSKDQLLHIRTLKDYKNIWEAFLEKEEEEFSKHMGYTKKDIEKIGVNKFIDFQDWRNIDDISKWRTDALQVIPCCNCRNEFSIFQEFGLCTNCKSLFDFELLTKVMERASQRSKESVFDILVSFVYDEGKRSLFLKSNRNSLKALYLTLKDAEEGKLNEVLGDLNENS